MRTFPFPGAQRSTLCVSTQRSWTGVIILRVAFRAVNLGGERFPALFAYRKQRPRACLPAPTLGVNLGARSEVIR